MTAAPARLSGPLGPERPEGRIRDTSGTDVPVRPSRRPGRAILAAIGALTALLGATYLLGPSFGRWLGAEAAVPEARLRLGTVTRGPFVRDLVVEGVVVAAVRPTLFAPAPGTVTFSVQAGDPVRVGDLLGHIDSPELRNELAQESAALESLRSQVERRRIEQKRSELENQQAIDLGRVRLTAAERELRRAESARLSEAISEQDHERARDDVDRARLEITHARQDADLEREELAFELRTAELAARRQALRVEELQRQVEGLEIRSPVEGMVGNLAVDQKARVATDTALLTVVDLRAFEIEVSVPEGYVNDLAPGLEARIRQGDRELDGHLAAVAPEVRGGRVSGRVRFSGSAPEGLRQNQRATVRLILDARDDVLLVPRGPFFDAGGGRTAWVVRDGIARRRTIRIGAGSVEALHVLEGLAEGERIVLSSLADHADAETVRIIP